MKNVLFIMAIATVFVITACGGSNDKNATQKTEQGASGKYYYTCEMHPEIHQDKPGSCPKCGMELVKKEGSFDQQKAK
ncbi:hypothetical protein SDC9_65998 [bioreactor metagenome]|uniref:Heavy metal binding domain-containing protein n=1 Tax=bioreactor metagenome TaxID=1076179 RepID=A0A644XTP0_9ZZZZ